MNENHIPPAEVPQSGIGTKNESALHAAIKNWYALPEDEPEAKEGRYIIDIKREGLLIEIQTKNFSAIGKKLRALTKKHKVRLIYPVSTEKWIIKTDPEGNLISRKKSPKKGSVYDIFNELIRIPDLVDEANLSIEILFIKEEEIRCDDGKGSWRRKGVSILDRKLVDVIEKKIFQGKKDFLDLLPQDLEQPFSNKILAEKLGIPANKARKITYCLKKAGALKEVGKQGNTLLYESIP